MPILLFSTLLAADDARIVDLRTGDDATVEAVVAELAECDVVFLGELHDNPAGHELHHDLVARLHAQRPDLAISLEMFERDVQGVVDDYLRGRIDEETFLRESRPWRDYEPFYKPFVESARRHRLDVIAGNVPRDIASKISKGEEPTRDEHRYVPRVTTTPDDGYRERFVDLMKSHVGTGGDDAMQRYYAAQCLKDDAMAEAIVDHLAVRGTRRPLVVHVCGSFHVEHGHGTALRVLTRRPLLRTAVVTMEAVDDVAGFTPERGDTRAHYVVVVPQPREESSESGKSAATESESD